MECLKLYVEEETVQRVKQAARAKGLSASSWMRVALLEKLKRVTKKGSAGMEG